MSQPRVALVTGSASGIGRATADRLVGDGWRVVGIDMKTASGARFDAIKGDASSVPVLSEALEGVGAELHGLVCAAGLPPLGPWDDREAWDRLLRVDLSGPYDALRLAMPALARAKGAAVLVGSIVGPAEGSARSPGYAAAKAGLAGLMRSLALIGAEPGVRVNLVEPGPIDTPLDTPRFPVDDRPDVPLGRMGTADEVAAAVCFLLGDEAGYITGSTLRIDGGRTIRTPASR